LVNRRRYLAQISLGIEAVRRATAAACWMAMNWPESPLSLTSAYAWTIFAADHVEPLRHRVHLDADLLGPVHLEEAQRHALVGEQYVGRVLDDHHLVLVGKLDHPFVEIPGRDRPGRAIRVVDDEQLGPLLHIHGDTVEVREEAVLLEQREPIDLAAVVARLRAGDRVAGDGH
jgi:hypothetical protein